MKSAKRIFSLVLALFTLIGSAGIPVFIHQCKEDGVFRSFIVKQSMHCEIEKIDDLPPCCAKKTDNTKHTSVDSHCCDERTDFFKVKFESKPGGSVDLIQVCQIATFENFPTPRKAEFPYESKEAGWINRPPPKPSGKELLILKQVFRI